MPLAETGGNQTTEPGAVVELNVTRKHIEEKHFVTLGRDADGKFNKAEIRNTAETLAVGAQSVEQILSECGVDMDAEEFVLTFSPNTGEIIAAQARQI